MEPSGFLSFKEAPSPGDKLILYPVYLFPIEVLERGLFVRASYYYQTVIVNAFNRNIRLSDVGETAVCIDFDVSPFETLCLEIRVSPQLAGVLAEYGDTPDNFRSWHKIVRNRKVTTNAGNTWLVWHAYAIRGGQAVDTFTGETAVAPALHL